MPPLPSSAHMKPELRPASYFGMVDSEGMRMRRQQNQRDGEDDYAIGGNKTVLSTRRLMPAGQYILVKSEEHLQHKMV